MLRKTIIIKNKYGIHARPAAQIVAVCNRYTSDIYLIKDGEAPANAKNILDIMMLGVQSGSKLDLQVDGEDAELAMESLSSLIEGSFGNEE